MAFMINTTSHMQPGLACVSYPDHGSQAAPEGRFMQPVNCFRQPKAHQCIVSVILQFTFPFICLGHFLRSGVRK